MNRESETIVISLGGSIIVPGEIQVDFLKKFREFILEFLEEGVKFVIVAGGGAIARNYQKAAGEITQLTDEDKDWLGIHATRFNAHLLRTIFKKEAYPVVLDSPQKPVKGKNHRLFIASGWKPGWSTDYDAVLLVKRFKASKIINASNVDYVYDKNPNEFKDANPFKEITWQDYLKIAGTKWVPGMNVPFDPIASRVAKDLKMTVFFTKGTDLPNMSNIIRGKNFNGTTIHP
ncbi:MAG: UMP kinase [Candidatus Nealsonbacteria bacterium]